MPLATCKKCGFQLESEEVPEAGDWLCSLCSAAPTGQPCPGCSTELPAAVAQPGRKLKCPACGQSLRVTAAGTVETYDEFKEYLRKRTTEVRLKKQTGPQRRATGLQPKAEAQEPETEAEAGHAPAGLLLGILISPYLAAAGLLFWKDGLAFAQKVLPKILGALGIQM
jgi:transcription elongation factor Elf1